MRDIPTSPRIIEIRHNRRVKTWRLVILVFILLVSLVWAASYFSSDEYITIENIVISGNHIIDKSDIENQIQNDISGKYLYLFSRSNSFIYPHRQIYNNLLLKFPRIEKLSVSRDNLKTLHVDIVERTSSSLYCGPNVPLEIEEIGENCFFINNDGFIFDEAPYFSGNVYFKYYMALENEIVNPKGKQMVDENSFHKIARFIDEITAMGFKPIYIAIEKDGTNYLYLNHGANDTIPYFIFKNDSDLNLIRDNLALSMKKKEFAEEINTKYNTLLYIDLRFKNKVLYKFK